MGKNMWEIGAEIKPGSIVRVKRTYYYHYGIYVGESEVVHFSAENDDGIHTPEAVKVIKTSVDRFLRGGVPELRRYSFTEKRRINPPDKVISLALSRLGEGGYDATDNNCEDFANECVFGKKLPRG